jgi:hypothetical protein
VSIGVDKVVAALVALVLAAISFVIVPASWSPTAKGVVVAAIALGFWTLLYLLRRLVPWAVRRGSVIVVRSLVFALRQWAEQSRELTGKDTTWNWLTDQLLVAQGRYAFSVSCIAFALSADGSLRCLLLRRRFEQFGNTQIWMWPGGRFRGCYGR